MNQEELKPCPLCGRKAIKTEEYRETGCGGLTLLVTHIQCEGMSWETRDIPGCNCRVSASGEGVAERMWQSRHDAGKE